MDIPAALLQRADTMCELCTSSEALQAYDVTPVAGAPVEPAIVVCKTCHEQISGVSSLQSDHWQCLSSSMWSETPAVQALAMRILSALAHEAWAKDLLDMLYLDEALKDWALSETLGEKTGELDRPPTKDSNGTVLQDGDTVTLIKDLQVKGAGFTAKRGTVVRNIRLTDNPEHIEGRVNAQHIVLVSAYLKKA